MTHTVVTVITQAGVAPGLAVLAPLARCLHFTRMPYGPVPMEHPCSSATFRPRPAGSPGILTPFSAADACPDTPSACLSASLRVA